MNSSKNIRKYLTLHINLILKEILSKNNSFKLNIPIIKLIVRMLTTIILMSSANKNKNYK